MNIVEMKQFGATLTDREDGKKTFSMITEKYALPVALDFSEVVSLGSSFGDEVVPKIALMQGGEIELLNANRVIRNSIKRTVEELPVRVVFDVK